MPPSPRHLVVTSPTDGPPRLVPVVGGVFSATLAAQSVTTFVSN
jgi:hypothetical protein